MPNNLSNVAIATLTVVLILGALYLGAGGYAWLGLVLLFLY
jgi:hypothetical protein